MPRVSVHVELCDVSTIYIHVVKPRQGLLQSSCVCVCVCVCVRPSVNKISPKKYLTNQLHFWWTPSPRHKGEVIRF